MAKNEFLPFGTAEGANVLSNQEYEALAARHNGFNSGVAKSKELNKVWRQASLITSAVAQFIVDTDQTDLLDDGNVPAIKSRLLSAMKEAFKSEMPAVPKTVQTTGASTSDVMSQKAVTDSLNKKIEKSAVVQTVGSSTTDIMSQNAITELLTNFLQLTGGTLTGQVIVTQDGPAIVISPTTENGACYLQGRDHEGKATWFIGLPTDGGSAVYFRNYLSGTEMSLHPAGVTIKGKLSLSDYSNFDDRYGQPVGSVVFLLHGDTPTGRYIKANGAAISRTTYTDLYAVLGVKYGSGNGSTTFNVPDLRGEFPRFWDDGRGIDSGRVLGTTQGDAMRNLTGTLTKLYGESGGGTGVFRGVSVANSSKYSSGTWEGDRATEFNASYQVPTAGEFRPRNIALAAWIKY